MSKPPPSDTAKAYHHGNLRRAILDAAEELVKERGIDGLSLRECARRAGVSPAAPAHHFKDKRGLLNEFANEGLETLIGLVGAELTDAGDDPVLRVRAVGRGYIRAALEHPPHFRVMTQCRVFSPTDEAEPGDSASSEGNPENERLPVLELLASLIAALDQADGREPDQLAERAVFAWSAVHGFSLLLLDNAQHPSIDFSGATEEGLKKADDVLDRVLAGLRSSAS
ncbi:MAG: TetR/AcrR family transcriptional regulator [Planctomycetota bacterium]